MDDYNSYGINLVSSIRNLSGKINSPDLNSSIDALTKLTEKIDSEKQPILFRQVMLEWRSTPKKVKEYLRQNHREFIETPHTCLSRNRIDRRNIPCGVSSIPGVARETSTVEKSELKEKWFSKVDDALGTLGSIIEFGNMSDADWDGTCAKVGLDAIHGLFGKKDVEGVNIWDEITSLFQKEEDKENEEKPVAKAQRLAHQKEINLPMHKDRIVETKVYNSAGKEVVIEKKIQADNGRK